MTSTGNSSQEQRMDIIERIGGERDFQFVVIALVDRLQEDPKLAKFFSIGNFDSNNLAAHQEEFLKTIFEMNLVLLFFGMFANRK